MAETIRAFSYLNAVACLQGQTCHMSARRVHVKYLVEMCFAPPFSHSSFAAFSTRMPLSPLRGPHALVRPAASPPPADSTRRYSTRNSLDRTAAGPAGTLLKRASASENVEISQPRQFCLLISIFSFYISPTFCYLFFPTFFYFFYFF